MRETGEEIKGKKRGEKREKKGGREAERELDRRARDIKRMIYRTKDKERESGEVEAM